MQKLPRGWARIELGELVEITSGGTPNRATAAYWGGEVPWVTAKDMKSFELHGSIEQLSAAGAARVSVVPADTVLMLVRGMGLFKDVPIGLTMRPMAFNQDVKALRPKGRLLPRFLAYALQQKRHVLMRQVDHAGHGTGRLQTAFVEELPLWIPELQEQILICNFLDLVCKRESYYREIVFSKKKLLESLIDNLFVSKTGKFKKLSDLLSESNGIGSTGATAKKITVRLYGNGVVSKEEKRDGSEKTKYYVRRSGQLIYSKLDFLNGAFGIVPPELDMYESTVDLPAFDIDKSINPKWLLEFLTRPSYYSRQIGLAKGQRKARRVNPSDFLASEIRVPSRKDQDEVEKTIGVFRRDLDLAVDMLRMLNQQKIALMEYLLTGKKRLVLEIHKRKGSRI